MEKLSSNNVADYKQHLLRMFADFIRICEENSLQWCCAGGTLLGVVRHKGFIPWDDDIDVFMPRNDYNKLIALDRDLREQGYGILSIYNHNGGATFSKFWDCRTTLWELEEVPFVYGVYIDIFPLDFTDMTQQQFLQEYKKRRLLNAIYQLSQMRVTPRAFINRIKQRDKKFITKDILQFLVPRILSPMLRNKMIAADISGQQSSGSHLASWYGDYWAGEYLKSEWFDTMVDGVFEGIKVKMPCGYDAYLSGLYHDYMKLPPKEKQVSHHYHYYLNFEKHLTIEQVKQIKRNKL